MPKNKKRRTKAKKKQKQEKINEEEKRNVRTYIRDSLLKFGNVVLFYNS